MSPAIQPGRLIGLGLGPGDPDLVTVKAMRHLQGARLVACFAKAGRCGIARTIARTWMPETCEILALDYPVTTEMPFEGDGYRDLLGAFYADAADTLAARLEDGEDVILLCEGDPLFYGSFMHLYIRLRGRFSVEIVPGVTGMSGCWTAAGEPMTWGDDVLTVLPATLPAGVLRERLIGSDALVFMKLGQNLPKVRAALDAAGLLDRATYVERGTMAEEIVLPLREKTGDEAPYFSVVLVPGDGRRP
jgi:precorrin-2/cobalt-factor-2 C20-methyltransferase